jgi:hypothetical protein
MMKIAFTGGRNYNNKERVYQLMNTLSAILKDYSVIVGDATGLDSLVVEYCKEHNIEHTVYYANWKKYKQAAGPIRNKEMAELNPFMLIAFPGGKGTANMVSECQKRNITVYFAPEKSNSMVDINAPM